MRKLGVLLLTSVLGLSLVLTADGQTTLTPSSARSFLTGVDPAAVKPPDLSKFNKTTNANGALRPPTNMSAFNTSKMFPKLTLGTWPPRTAAPPQFPTPPKGSKTLFPINTATSAKPLFSYSKGK